MIWGIYSVHPFGVFKPAACLLKENPCKENRAPFIVLVVNKAKRRYFMSLGYVTHKINVSLYNLTRDSRCGLPHFYSNVGNNVGNSTRKIRKSIIFHFALLCIIFTTQTWEFYDGCCEFCEFWPIRNS